MLKINDGRKKVYVILGMHHSATSFVSKSLFNQGVFVGDRFNTDIDLYEDLDFVTFNEKVLSTADGDWKDVPAPEKIEWAFNVHKEEAVRILTEKLSHDFWGWKDPRNSLTGHLWIRLLKELNPDLDVYLICIFREPEKVAGSLSADDYDEMIALNKIYNESIIRIIKEFTNV